MLSRKDADACLDSPVRKKRLDSPSDAFKDVFSEYGAKLSPALMRLQLEGDLPFDDEAPESRHDRRVAQMNSDQSDDNSEENLDDKEEEAFLASQRESRRKQSNPTSKQNSAGQATSGGRCSHEPIQKSVPSQPAPVGRLITPSEEACYMPRQQFNMSSTMTIMDHEPSRDFVPQQARPPALNQFSLLFKPPKDEDYPCGFNAHEPAPFTTTSMQSTFTHLPTQCSE